MQDVFAIVVGGLGQNQTGDIAAALKAVPGVDVWSPGDWNAWEANLAQAVRVRAPQRLAIIGHSFGGCTAVNACFFLSALSTQTPSYRVDYLGLVDPVAHNWRDMALVGGDARPVACDVFYRSEYFGPRTAAIQNATASPLIIPNTTHNSLPHDPRVIAAIVARVTALTGVTQ